MLNLEKGQIYVVKEPGVIDEQEFELGAYILIGECAAQLRDYVSCIMHLSDKVSGVAHVNVIKFAECVEYVGEL